jgi:predicted MPP superfamily phosphohydrolase
MINQMKNRLQRVLIILSALLAYSAYKIHQLSPGHIWTTVLSTFLLALTVLSPFFIYRKYATVFDKFWFRTLYWAGALLMGLWATLLIISFPFDTIFAAFSVAGRMGGPGALSHTFYLPVFVICFLMTALGFAEAVRGPKVKSIYLPLAHLPNALSGFKILQISDLHVGPTIRKGYVDDVVKKANVEQPDLIVFTGDIADAHPVSIIEHLKPLANLKSRYGVFYVTGNHEYFWHAPDIISEVRALGFVPLINENVTLKIEDCKVLIAGITDPVGGALVSGHAPDLKKADAGSSHADFKILLAHRPDACHEAETRGYDLQFSGHTHAGQFFPFSLFIGLAHKYSRGLYRHGKMWLYVNPGTGYWGPANRLGVASEITLLTLGKI